MKRYSARVVEEAALICQIAASNNRLDWYIACAIGASADAYDLAVCACTHTVDASRLLTGDAMSRAEAEALLRCGWRPA